MITFLYFSRSANWKKQSYQKDSENRFDRGPGAAGNTGPVITVSSEQASPDQVNPVHGGAPV
jgi:hypothetical protein